METYQIDLRPTITPLVQELLAPLEARLARLERLVEEQHRLLERLSAGEAKPESGRPS